MTNSSYPAVSQGHAHGRFSGTAQVNCVPMSWHKWRDLLPALRLAREPLGLNKSRLDLLEKMLACVPGETISTDANGRLIVFASNARLAEMTHRDNDKTITRLITELEDRGLLERRSSPNGKRYARQGRDGLRVAYGIDLGPLLHRMPEIEALAQEAEDHIETCRRLREACSLMLTQLSERAGGQDDLSNLLTEGRRILRRKPDESALKRLHRTLVEYLGPDIPDGNLLPPEPKPEQTQLPEEPAQNDPCAPQNTCHKDTPHIPFEEKEPLANREDHQTVSLTPQLVEKNLPRVANLGRQIKGSLRDLVEQLRNCLGISANLWRSSLEKHGFQESSMVLMVIYERQRQIRHAPGYFAKVTKTEGQGGHAGSKLISAMISNC